MLKKIKDKKQAQESKIDLTINSTSDPYIDPEKVKELNDIMNTRLSSKRPEIFTLNKENRK